MNAGHPGTQWRAKWPNAYKIAGVALASNDHHHRDMMQRAKSFPSDDYYLSPWDGHLAKLFVQSTQAVYDGNLNSTWKRTFIRNRSPLILRVANWVLHTLPTDDREVKGEDLAMMGLKWIPSCAAILLLVSSFSHMEVLYADTFCFRCSILCKLLDKSATEANTMLCPTSSGDTHITLGTHKKA